MRLLLCRGFHSSIAVGARQKYLKKINKLHKHWAKQLFRPQPEYVDPVLGRPQVPFLARLRADIGQPEGQIDSFEPEATSRLVFGAEIAHQKRLDELQDVTHVGLQAAHKREALARIISLSNSSGEQLQKKAINIAEREFARKEGDTGSPEVQAAVLTVRIHFLARHLKENRKDLQTKRRIEHLVQTRRILLLYLKRKDPRRYLWTIEKLGLSDDAVTAEFHMSRKYLWQTQFFGDKTLPLKKTKKDTRRQRQLERRKERALRYLTQNNPEMLL